MIRNINDPPGRVKWAPQTEPGLEGNQGSCANYSHRNATIGLTFIARRAGI